MIWDYLAAEARERRLEREHDEFVAELAVKQGKSRTAEFLERIGFLGRLVTYFAIFGLLAMWVPRFRCVSEATCRGDS